MPSGSRRPLEAKAFYGAIVAATFAGIGINFSPIDRVTAVVNGVVAVPVMTMMMLITSNAKIMGRFTITGHRRIVGWAATGFMAAAALECCLRLCSSRMSSSARGLSGVGQLMLMGTLSAVVR